MTDMSKDRLVSKTCPLLDCDSNIFKLESRLYLIAHIRGIDKNFMKHFFFFNETFRTENLHVCPVGSNDLAFEE